MRRSHSCAGPYGLDLPWLSLGLRVRGSFASGNGGGDAVPRRHYELGVGLVVQRSFDLRWLSLSFGVVVEGVYHHQSFDTTRQAPDRRTFGGAFGGLLLVDRQIVGGLNLHVELGPMTTFFERSRTSRAPRPSTRCLPARPS